MFNWFSFRVLTVVPGGPSSVLHGDWQAGVIVMRSETSSLLPPAPTQNWNVKHSICPQEIQALIKFEFHKFPASSVSREDERGGAASLAAKWCSVLWERRATRHCQPGKVLLPTLSSRFVMSLVSCLLFPFSPRWLCGSLALSCLKLLDAESQVI